MLKSIMLDAVGLAAAVCGGFAVHAWLGRGATWAYAAIVLTVLWSVLGDTNEGGQT